MSNVELTNKIQERLSNMLIELKKILDDNNIRYFLAFGSVLGSVRHNGFIPWDNDLDIYIYGKDYEKLRNVFNNKDTGNLVLHDPFNQVNYPYSFPKIVDKTTLLIENSFKSLNYKCGIYIDVFLLVESDANHFMRYINEKRRYYNYCLLRLMYMNYERGLRFLMSKVVKKFFNPNKIQKKLYNYYCRNENKDSSDYIDIGSFGKKAILSKSIFYKDKLSLFENEEYPIPIKYDQYLKFCYGDYMKLPKMEDRVSNHDFYKVEM